MKTYLSLIFSFLLIACSTEHTIINSGISQQTSSTVNASNSTVAILSGPIDAGFCRHDCDVAYENNHDSSRLKQCIDACEKPRPGPSHPTKYQRIENCEVVQATALGYDHGNMHQICLSWGWNGGRANNSGFCFRSPSTPPAPAIDCPRLNSYANCTNGNCCAYLTREDADTLMVCR